MRIGRQALESMEALQPGLTAGMQSDRDRCLRAYRSPAGGRAVDDRHTWQPTHATGFAPGTPRIDGARYSLSLRAVRLVVQL